MHIVTDQGCGGAVCNTCDAVVCRNEATPDNCPNCGRKIVHNLPTYDEIEETIELTKEEAKLLLRMLNWVEYIEYDTKISRKKSNKLIKKIRKFAESS